MNKQELIDEAVHSHKGVWPAPVDCITSTDFKGSFCEWVKKEEFQQRARELGYVNGYRWGVEYPTNGKKPDLPSDIAVSVFDEKDESWWYEDIAGHFSWKEGCTAKFKITDTRYKPADTSCLETPALEPVPEEESWYDYTNQKALRLPPVGAECLTWFDDGRECWQKCKVLALSPYEQDHMAVSLIGRHDRKLIWSQDFMPLDHETRKSEAERKIVVDAAFASLTEFNKAHQVLRELYDAGFLRMPEDK